MYIYIYIQLLYIYIHINRQPAVSSERKQTYRRTACVLNIARCDIAMVFTALGDGMKQFQAPNHAEFGIGK